MRKPTVLIVIEAGVNEEQRAKIAASVNQDESLQDYAAQVSEAKLSQTALGTDPWSLLDCPVCERSEFVTLDMASAWCNHCNAQFLIGPTSGDPGFVVRLDTREVSESCAVHPELVGYDVFRVIKTADEDSGWLVKCANRGVVSVGHFLRVEYPYEIRINNG